jgi:hypothetical protein
MAQVHFLPWAGIKKPLQIGRVTIEPWRSVRSRLPKPAVTFLDVYFKRYVNNDGTSVDDIALVFAGTDPIGDITPIQRRVLRRAVDALTFASTLPHLLTILRTQNTSFGLPRSERFQMITQFFQSGQTSVAVVSGGVMHAWGLADVHFCIPWCAGSSMYQTDEDVLTALGLVLNGRRGAPTRERLFRALEWFRLAHTGSDDTDDASRLVMMATTFEVLLEPPNPFQKRSAMGEALTVLTQRPDLKVKDVKIANKIYKFNAPAAWLDIFYQVRNSIVHGDKLKQKSLAYPVAGRPWLTHLHVADLVMWEIVLWELVAVKLLGKDAMHLAMAFAKLFSGKVTPSLVRHIAASNLGIDDMHKNLAWCKSQRDASAG